MERLRRFMPGGDIQQRGAVPPRCSRSRGLGNRKNSIQGRSDYRERGDARRTRMGGRSLGRHELGQEIPGGDRPGEHVIITHATSHGPGAYPPSSRMRVVSYPRQAGSGVIGIRDGDAPAEAGESYNDGRA